MEQKSYVSDNKNQRRKDVIILDSGYKRKF
jgi:hypothetical protein